jgi:hypothetical protein
VSALAKTHRPFLLLLLAIATLRLATLFASQRHVHSDEAIIGLMAKHVLDHHARPTYFYGQSFNGGAALEAYLAAPVFALLGPDVVPLKLVVVALSLATLCVFYALVAAYWNRRVALVASALLALSPTLSKWNFQARGPYGEYLLFVLLVVFATLRIAEERTRRWGHYALLGLAAGAGLWCIEMLLPVVLVAVAYLGLTKRSALRDRSALLAWAAFFVGYAPSLVYNLRTGGANWKALAADRLSAGWGAAAALDMGSLWRVVSFEMPRFFGPDTVLWYHDDAPVSGIVVYAIFAAVAAYSLRRYGSALAATIRGSLARRETPGGAEREPFVLLVSLACAAAYMLPATRVPSYLIDLIPFACLMTALAIDDGLRSMRPFARRLAQGALLALLAVGSWEAGRLLRTDRVESLAFDGERGLVPTAWSGESTRLAIDHLLARDIHHVFATPSVQYPLIFESREQVIASSAAFAWNYCVFPPYDEAVRARFAERPAFVMERASPLRAEIAESLAARGVAPVLETELGDLVVIETRQVR